MSPLKRPDCESSKKEMGQRKVQLPAGKMSPVLTGMSIRFPVIKEGRKRKRWLAASIDN